MSNLKQHETLRTAFHQGVTNELDDAIRKICFCVRQLSDDQLSWRPSDSMNSIANLILHLCGNVRQWVISGVGGAPDQRNRPQEFAQREPVSADQLIEMLHQVAGEFRQTLEKTTADDLIRPRTIQGYEVSGLQAVIESVAHFRGHTQEITHMTRIQLGDAYEFDFIPSPGQQGGEVG
jgi:uncharacterized damage-inducible protein DinB